MPATESKFLVVRLGSMGDIIHALPAARALRQAFPAAPLDWVVDFRWRPILDQVPFVNSILSFDRRSWRDIRRTVAELRRARYACVIDFQGLYKSALLARLSGAPRRVGFARSHARESGAALFYTDRVAPAAAHVVMQNLALAERAGAQACGSLAAAEFPLRIPPEAAAMVARIIGKEGVQDYFVLSPGGGWKSKCWPPERYGELHRRLASRLGCRGLVTFGPGERALAEGVLQAAGEPAPLVLDLDLPELMAALRGARVFIGGDTGPLHLAAALRTPVVGLYGPTDPARNGPYSPADIVVRNATPEQTTYRRGSEISPAMLSITVDQVEHAVARRLGLP
jgi:heptosyltransferase-1